MRRYKRLIIADDLTGANDSGIHFLSIDKSVGVVTDSEGHVPEKIEDTLVINTDSRMLPPEEAYSKLLRTIEQYALDNEVEIFKKIDSTLRGNVGAEIDALIDGKGFDLVCVAPASPRNGRKVVSGLCYINDVLLEDSEIALDPFTPVKKSAVKEILSSQTERKIGNLMIEQIRSGSAGLKLELDRFLEDNVKIVIADSETIDDLYRIQRAFSNSAKRVLFVGAAGLYHAMFEKEQNGSEHEFIELNDDYRFLFVIGSLMDTTLKQIDWINRLNPVSTTILSSSGAINTPDDEIKSVADSLKKSFESHNRVMLKTENKVIGSNSIEDSGRIGFVAGESVKKVLEENEIDVFLLSGGDTALHVLRQLKINYLRLVDEVLPGIPVCIAVLPDSEKEIVIITKAGSYGDEDAFEKIFTYLTGKIRRQNDE